MLARTFLCCPSRGQTIKHVQKLTNLPCSSSLFTDNLALLVHCILFHLGAFLQLEEAAKLESKKQQVSENVAAMAKAAEAAAAQRLAAAEAAAQAALQPKQTPAPAAAAAPSDTAAADNTVPAADAMEQDNEGSEQGACQSLLLWSTAAFALYACISTFSNVNIIAGQWQVDNGKCSAIL